MKELKKDKIAIICLVILLSMIICILLAPYLTTYDPNTQVLTDKLEGISSRHLLGTDQLGRDIFSRILYGGRTTLLLGMLLTIIIAIVGLALGILASINKTCEVVIMSVCNLFLSLPNEMLVLVIIAIVGPSLWGLILAVTLARWPWFVKMIHSDVSQIWQQEYVEYARINGESKLKIIQKHILQNIKNDLIVYTTLDMSGLIMSIAALSFLGIGIQPPVAEWGRMLSEAREVAIVYPWQMIPAGVAIFLIAVILNYLGDVFAKYEGD